jgi:hypothetical protein
MGCDHYTVAGWIQEEQKWEEGTIHLGSVYLTNAHDEPQTPAGQAGSAPSGGASSPLSSSPSQPSASSPLAGAACSEGVSGSQLRPLVTRDMVDRAVKEIEESGMFERVGPNARIVIRDAIEAALTGKVLRPETDQSTVSGLERRGHFQQFFFVDSGHIPDGVKAHWILCRIE